MRPYADSVILRQSETVLAIQSGIACVESTRDVRGGDVLDNLFVQPHPVGCERLADVRVEIDGLQIDSLGLLPARAGDFGTYGFGSSNED